MNFPVQIQRLAELHPDKPALVWKEGMYTYRELNDDVNRFGHALCRLGLQQGDRVALQLLNCREFVVAYLAVMKIGGIIVPINPLYKGKDLGDIMKDSEASVLITSTGFAENIIKLKPSLETFNHLILTCNGSQASEFNALSFDELKNQENPEEISVTLEDDQLAEIIYTSGTTGFAKGAMLTHNNLYSNAETFSELLSCTPEERILIVAPIFHSAAQTCCMTTCFLCGGTSYLIERWTNATDVLNAMQEWEITFFFGPPTMYTFLLAQPQISSFDLKLRIAFTGAASLPVEVFNKWRDIFGFEIIEGYGLSETSPVVTINPPEGVKKPASIGCALPRVDARIFNENGNELPTGEIGEIVVKGPNVMAGYWNNPEATAQAIRDGWFYTGDLAYKDEEGYIFIVDRKKDMINRGGLKVYPREVEEVLYRHPAVMEAAVIGIPDKLSEEAVKAFIVLREGQQAKPSDFKWFCSEHLANFKVPKTIEILEALPKTATGKVLKTELRKISK